MLLRRATCFKTVEYYNSKKWFRTCFKRVVFFFFAEPLCVLILSILIHSCFAESPAVPNPARAIHGVVSESKDVEIGGKGYLKFNIF